MSAGGLIYIAGNPDLYPLEYYDPDAGTYQGTIPSVLAQFAQESGYDLQYYQPGATDRRAELAENKQVDAVSGCTDREAVSGAEQVTLFQAEIDGQTVTYSLIFTDSAPEDFVQALRSYLSGVTQPEWTGAMLQSVSQSPQSVSLLPVSIGLGLTVCLLLAALTLSVRRFRRQLRQAERFRSIDPETGLDTMEYLQRRFPAFVHDKNRVLYHVVYFYLDLGHVERLGGHMAATAMRRHASAVLQTRLGPGSAAATASNAGIAAVILAGTTQKAREWALSVLEQIRAFTDEGGNIYPLDAAAGLYSLQPGDHDLNLALFYAEQCARLACREGEGLRLCSQDVCRAFEEERQLLADVSEGFRQEQFRIYLQFYVNASNFEIVGGEMLARWQHNRKGLLLPGQFVPLMEREGLVSRLDYYCLEKVCAFLEMLGRNGVQNFFISCNFARSTITSASFVEKCKEIISRHCFSRELLVFEVTESEKSRDQAQMDAHIREMRAFGVRVLFDDFGVGFSSFHDLQESDMDGLKLDKYLVENISTPQGRSILNAMVQAGHELGLTILAEGVEQAVQAQVLQQLGCDVLQGFYFSRPMPAEQSAQKIIKQFRTSTGHSETDARG